MKTFIQTAWLLYCLCSVVSCSRNPDVPAPFTFDGPSDKLTKSEVVPSLESAIPDGKNTIWCASFQAAWWALRDLAGQPVTLEGSPAVVKLLNDSPDPRSHIPPQALFVAAGWNDQGITNQIRKDFENRFPNQKAPSFPGILPGSVVSYSHLEADVKFDLPYDQNERPLLFTEGGGTQVQINSFAILRSSGDKLWEQPRVLFRKGEGDDFEFAVDLCSTSHPSQIVVARVERGLTLGATLRRVEDEIVHMAEAEAQTYDRFAAESLRKVQPLDTLNVPDLRWAVSHRFAELEGKLFASGKLNGQRLDVAQQDIVFRLGKNGAALRSESKMVASGIPSRFVLDRPFLIYMKQRGAVTPYFVMWVENAELLSHWDSGKAK